MKDSFFLPQYAAQAVVDLEQDVKNIKKAMKGSLAVSSYLLSARSMEGLAGLIRSAVHVVLPPNGEIYRDNQFGGAMPTPAEVQSFEGLPAPVTCFEYPWTHPKQATDPTVGTKRITVVVDYRQLHNGPLPVDHHSVQIYSIYYHEGMALSSPENPQYSAARGSLDRAHNARLATLPHPATSHQDTPQRRPDVRPPVFCGRQGARGCAEDV